MIDDIDVVIWRPYLGCEEWEDDVVELPYTFQSRHLIGRMPYVLERQLVNRVGRQFGRIQRMPQGSGMYARIVRVQAQFGPLLSYDQTMTQLLEMMPLPWDMWPEIEDAGMDAEYIAYWAEHPFPRLMDLGELFEGDGGGDDDDGADGGRGRRRRRGAVGERRVAPWREGGEERQAWVVRGHGGLPLQVPAT